MRKLVISHTQEVERDRGWCSAHFLLSSTLETPALSDNPPQLNLFGNTQMYPEVCLLGYPKSSCVDHDNEPPRFASKGNW